MSAAISIPFVHPAVLGVVAVVGMIAFMALPHHSRRLLWTLLIAISTAMSLVLLGLLPATGHLTLGAWSIALTVAFSVAYIGASRRARKVGLPSRLVADLLLFGGLSGIIGCRLKWLWDFWPHWAVDAKGSALPWRERLAIAADIDGGGAVLYGGLVLGALVGCLVCRVHRVRLSVVADAVAPSVLLAIACGRVGCFFNGCTWGTATTLPWGVAPSQQACAAGCEVGAALHPTALYESVATLVLGVLLAWWWRKRNTTTPDANPGRIAIAAVAGYAVWRFLVEFIRGDTNAQVLGTFFGLFPATSSQVVSLLVMIAIVVGLVIASIRRRWFVDRGDATP